MISRRIQKKIVEELREPIKVKKWISMNRGRGNSGKREDLDNVFFRSNWEANIARYLNILVEKGVIQHWDYEVIRFVFEPNLENKLKKGIKCGTKSYLPDFLVINNRGEIIFWEVKGYLDSRSKTQFKRMARFHPDIVVKVIGLKEYHAIERLESKNIIEWEGKRIKG